MCELILLSEWWLTRPSTCEQDITAVSGECQKGEGPRDLGASRLDSPTLQAVDGAGFPVGAGPRVVSGRRSGVGDYTLGTTHDSWSGERLFSTDADADGRPLHRAVPQPGQWVTAVGTPTSQPAYRPALCPAPGPQSSDRSQRSGTRPLRRG